MCTISDVFILSRSCPGGFGKVFLVRLKSHGTLHALKTIPKKDVEELQCFSQVREELLILKQMHNPFVVGLFMAFQTQDKLCFVLDYCSGGELFHRLMFIGKCDEQHAKFYVAEIVLALEYLHTLHVVYRDLKPENVMFDESGNIRITDFGCSKQNVSSAVKGASTFCGTPEYLAPEILLKREYGFAVDWWALGVLFFEMLVGVPPFYSQHQREMYQKILSASVLYPTSVSPSAKAVIAGLLNRDAYKRFGCGRKDGRDIRALDYFKVPSVSAYWL